MTNLFVFTDQFKLLVATLKGVLLIGLAIGVTLWYLKLNYRSTNQEQKDISFAYIAFLAFFLDLLFIDLVFPAISRQFTYPLAFSFALFLSNLFLLYILIPYVDTTLYNNIKRTLGAISLGISLLVLTNPIHQLIRTEGSRFEGQLHWLLNIFLYYGVASLLIGFFIYFSFPRQNRDWTNGITAIFITAIFIIFAGFALPHLDEWDLFIVLFVTCIYFVFVFELVSRSQRAPAYLKNLPIFERADIMMAIIDSDGSIKFASHGAAEHLDIFPQLDERIIRMATGDLHILDLDDNIYQWSSHRIQGGHLITIENVTDLMLALRAKEQEREELERQQLVMGTQSSIEQEIERIQYRLQLLADVETETGSAMAKLKNSIQGLNQPISAQDISQAKLWTRYIKRRAMIVLDSNDVMPLNWISLTIQELLDVAFGKNFNISVQPTVQISGYQLRLIQDLIMQTAQQLLNEKIEVLISVFQHDESPEMNLYFRSGETTDWVSTVERIFANNKVVIDADSVSVTIGLGEQ